MNQHITASLLLALSSICSATVNAQVTVKEAWIRATVAPQKVTGAFLQITSKQDAKLIAVSSNIADNVEIHSMEMEGDMMKMREIKDLPLPAGKTIELKPGGMHIMLFGLKKAVKEGEKIKLNLTVEDNKKQRQQVEVQATVKAMNGGM
ncbi:MAG: copper chaperone PCu(A)C [Burkholderiales bacterium]|nr:copper chaperone PCu(A)C [Burkholderiales bacterium]